MNALLPVLRLCIVAGSMLLPCFLIAQIPGGGGRPGGPGGAPGGNFNPEQFKIGRFYGRVVDATTGKGVPYASVQLTGMKFDTVTKRPTQAIIAGQLTEENGDFSLENLPIMGEFTLKIIFMGFATVEQKVSFGFKPGAGRPDMTKMDKDLGNIRLETDSKLLKEVTVSAEATTVQLALDKKVFRVDKNNMAAGGTAEDALRAVPSLAVDIDGNLTLRNAAPQIFVDGRPTTLSLDQLPADAIESVEVITNPSAKYDASGGGAGIVNIVLKKERRVGYNGSLRGGIDMRGRPNFGGDMNAREGKLNGFIGANLNLRRSIGAGETDRQNFFQTSPFPRTNVFQQSETQTDRWFANGRMGLDWFINNRNTLTFAGNYLQGRFQPEETLQIRTDSLFSSGTRSSDATRTSASQRGFRNFGGQLLYKKLFATEGKEWTADVNYNSARPGGEGIFTTVYANGRPTGRQRQTNEGVNDFFTVQTDFVTPLRNGIKMETGARAALRDYSSTNANFQYDTRTNKEVQVRGFADRYQFRDAVYAAYGTFSHSFKQWGYQVGLRVESSAYEGILPDADTTFVNNYPLSAFPSAFLTWKLNAEDNLQFNYSRRVTRPNFFQLIPFPDFSDSLQLSRGNPNLLPEFTNNLEISYQNIINKNHNLLASVYYRRTTDLITRYQFQEFNDFLNKPAIVSTYANANASYAYGLELVLKNTLFKALDLTSNLNFYNSVVNAENVETNLRNEQFTWFIKENLNLRLPKMWTIQINGEYQSRTALAAPGGGEMRRGGGGGGGWMGGPSSTAQGYTRPLWFLDLALRKDILKRQGSITLAVEDVFRSRRFGSVTSSTAFAQDSWRRRDPQFVRLNFAWRFGKFDASLFKRKNTRVEGVDGGF